MDLAGTKILVALLFGVLRFFFGILPLKLYKLLLHWEGEDDPQHFVNKRRHQQVTCVLALCQSFGGGVLFATCFLHMMPEVYKSMEVLKEYGQLNTDYPLSQMTISVGFFFVYFIEEFSHWFVAKVPDVTCEKNANLANRTISPLTKNKVSPVKKETGTFIIEDEMYKEKLETVSYNAEEMEENEKNNEKTLELQEDGELAQAEAIDEAMEKEVKTKQQIVRYVLIVLALSLHAIFEGLAIGLQHSIANIWYLFTAVSIHSATILFYISLELLLAKAKVKSIILHVLVLSVTSPIGVLLGLLITQKANMDTKAKSTAVVLLEGLSAGTILYITFFEVLNREKERRVYRLRRALCILSGFILMAVLQCTELYVK